MSSLLTRYPGALIIGGSNAAGGFLGGSPVLLTEEVSASAEGWDSLTQNHAIRAATLSAEALAALYPIGTQLAGRNWWLTGCRPTPVAPGVFTFELAFKGWAATKPVKLTWGTQAEQQTAENVGVPNGLGGTAVYAKVATHESAPTFTASYLSATATAAGAMPSMMVGRPHTRAGAPPVPDTVWGSLAKFVFHWPNGWTLMDLGVDILPGTTAGLVTESYKYIRDKSPG